MSISQALSMFTRQLNREWAPHTARGWASLLLDRLRDFVGSPEVDEYPQPDVHHLGPDSAAVHAITAAIEGSSLWFHIEVSWGFYGKIKWTDAWGPLLHTPSSGYTSMAIMAPNTTLTIVALRASLPICTTSHRARFHDFGRLG